MGSRTKLKPKPVISAANDPTPERMRRDVFDTIPAPRMADEIIGRDRLTHARKQASRVDRMRVNGWIDRRGQVALEIYEEKLEASGYGNTKSCLNITGAGGGGKDPSPTRAESIARDWLAVHEFALTINRDVDQLAVLFVRAVLQPYGHERLADVAERMLPGGRDKRMEIAADYCSEVANELANILER